MTVLTCASTAKSITLLKEIANSGEAKVWRTNQNGYLAKIYHSPTSERVQKLAVMIDHPPTEPNSHLHHVSFAWPKSALKNAQGDCVGFLMPEIKDGKELIDVYNPRRRQTLKLEINWRFLHTTALNIVSIIEALHAAGYVLGDIKPQNILVNNRALPSIIDTDSFQVKNPKNGKVYRCLVGSEGYTPPELMGKDFASIEQTEVHDRFRLGVIIYQLLFGGNNPFQGKWTGVGETPEPDEIIRRGLWLYSANSLIEPVPRTIPMIIVHPAIRECFLKCFNDGHKNPNFRPTAREWLKALRTGNDNLTICGTVDSHYYSRTFGNCYWCDRSTNLGVDIFPGVVKVNSSNVVESKLQSQVISNQFIGNLLQTLTGHSISVYSVAYSPDGQTLASGSRDKTIKLWNARTGKLLQTLTGHSSSVLSLAYSPDGQTLASGSDDKTIKLWDVKTGNLLQTFIGHSDWVRSVAYSPDGQTLASGSDDKTIKLWNVKTGNLLQTLTGHSHWVRSVAYSPDSQTLASGSNDKTIKLWNARTGNLLQTLTGHSDWVLSLAYSPDGQTLASGSYDKTIKLWNVKTGNLLQTLTGHSDWVLSLAYSPDGQTLASGSSDNTIKLWNVKTGNLLQTLTGHSDWVLSLAYSPDGQTLASGSSDNTIKIWQVAASISKAPVQQTPSQVSQTNQSTNTPRQVSQTPVYKPQSQPVKTQPSQTNKQKNLLLANTIVGIGFKIYGKVLLTSTIVGLIMTQIYGYDRYRLFPTNPISVIANIPLGFFLEKTLSGHSNTVISVAFSPDGKTLVSGSLDNNIKVWNVSTGKLLQTLTGHSDRVWSVAFSPDGQTLASGSDDKTIKLWDVRTGKLLQTLTGDSDFNSVAYSPDGQTLASGSRDETIKLWNASTGELLQSFIGHSSSVWSLAYSPDGKTLASGSRDDTIKLWNARTGKLLQTLTGDSDFNSVVFSPDGQTLASGSDDKTIKIWNVITGREIQSILGHSDSVRSVAFSPEGKTFASGSQDGTIKIWNLTTGKRLQKLTEHSNWVMSVAYSPDGKTLASGSKDGTIKIWRLK
jgi:WD40 repeat protein